jgi:hypothetical protein
MDYIVRTGHVTGVPVAKAQSDVYVHAIQMAKALKDVHFSGETENSNQDFKRYYARLNNAANGFPMILEVLENAMGHPFSTLKGSEDKKPNWPYQYNLKIYSAERRTEMRKPHYHHIVFSRNKAAIKAGLPINNCTLAEIDIAKQLTFTAKKHASKIAEAAEFVRLMAAHADLVADPTGATTVAALDETIARANASIAGEIAAQAVPATDPVSTGVATAFLTATSFSSTILSRKQLQSSCTLLPQTLSSVFCLTLCQATLQKLHKPATIKVFLL